MIAVLMEPSREVCFVNTEAEVAAAIRCARPNCSQHVAGEPDDPNMLDIVRRFEAGEKLPIFPRAA